MWQSSPLPTSRTRGDTSIKSERGSRFNVGVLPLSKASTSLAAFWLDRFPGRAGMPRRPYTQRDLDLIAELFFPNSRAAPLHLDFRSMDQMTGGSGRSSGNSIALFLVAKP